MKSEKRYREAFKLTQQNPGMVRFQSEQSSEFFLLSVRIWKLMGKPKALWAEFKPYYEEMEPE